MIRIDDSLLTDARSLGPWVEEMERAMAAGRRDYAQRIETELQFHRGHLRAVSLERPFDRPLHATVRCAACATAVEFAAR